MWMAHYLANLIVEAKAASGEDKSKKEKECFDCILKLWTHRDELEWKKPFESFDPIINLFRSFVNNQPGMRVITFNETEEPRKNSDWLQNARIISNASSSLVRWAVANAALEAREQDEWIRENIPPMFIENDQLYFITLLMLDSDALLSEDKRLSELQKQELDKIRSSLDALINISEALKNEMNKNI